jgi:nucleoside-diphosphate-sugar epimerase
MKAFVTGGTGFLGRAVVAELLARGADVRCAVRAKSDTTPLRELVGAPAADPAARLSFACGSLARPEQYESAMSGCDVVFHLAAAMKGATPVLFQHNVVGTERLIETASRCGVGRFVLISSLGVYGTSTLRKGDVLDERCPVDPMPHARDPYSYSKIAQEAAARRAAEKAALELVVVRPGVIYGPGRDCISGRVGLQIGRNLVMMGGRQLLPYTFVRNCAEAIVRAGWTPGIVGETFNIVDDDPPTARSLVRQYRRHVGKLRTIRVPHGMIQPLSRACQWYHVRSSGQLPAVLTPYKSAAMWKVLRYSNEKAKRLLQWRPRVTFQEGLEQTFATLRQTQAKPAQAPLQRS